MSIARALANEPALVLLDEPTGDLDSVTGQEIITLLQDLNRRESDAGGGDARPLIAQSSSRIIRLLDGRVDSSRGAA